MAIKQPDYQLKLQLDLPDDQAGNPALSTDEIRLRSEAARARAESGEAWKRDADGKPIPPMLMHEYYKLVEGGWDWRVAMFIIWLATPRKYRFPQTQEELATKVLGLTSDRRLSAWRTKNPVIDALARDIGVARSLERLNDSIDAMLEVAATPNYKGRGDRELHFKMAGILADKLEFEDVSDKDAQEMLKSLPFADLLKLAGVDTPEKIAALKERLKAQALAKGAEDENAG